MIPMVSVVMAVRNYNNLFLPLSLESILSQSVEYFEFIVVDGNSTDGTSEVLSSITDARLKHIRLDRDPGFTAMLNVGIEESRGRYVARQDADDVSHPRRLEIQSRYMEEHRTLDVLGTSVTFMDGMGSITGSLTMDFEHGDVEREIRFACPFPHGSMMARRDRLLRYDETMPRSQDYDLWLRMLDAGRRFRTIPLRLYTLRVHEGSVSFEDWRDQFLCAERARLRVERGVDVPMADVAALCEKRGTRSWMRLIAFERRRRMLSARSTAEQSYHKLASVVFQPGYWTNELRKKVVGCHRS
jgi:glycosyltransferase involved in cell wall biosynthesis